MFVENDTLRKALAENHLKWRLRTIPARYAKKDAITGELVTYPNPAGGDPVRSLPPKIRVDILFAPTMEIVHSQTEPGTKEDDAERVVTEAVSVAIDAIGKGALKTPADLARENEQLRKRLGEAGLGELEQEPGKRDPTGPEINEIEEMLRQASLKIPPGRKNAGWYNRCQQRLEEADTAEPTSAPTAEEQEEPLLNHRLPQPTVVDSEPEPATIP